MIASDDATQVRRLVFASDLHLFSDRSTAKSHRSRLVDVIADADVCVWGGDLFDFRWSRLSDDDTSTRTAIEWLDDWYERFPGTRFVYLNGNHDVLPMFQRRLIDWASRRKRFRAGLDAIRIGNTLLLHGDVIEGFRRDDGFVRYRAAWADKPVAGRAANRFYEWAVAARVHRVAAFTVHGHRTTCLRLARWIRGQANADGIERVVFGHTHRRIDRLRIGGYEFHNCGAAIRHVHFDPVVIENP